MLRKTTWMPFLLIGNFIVLLSACGEVDYAVKGDYIYINATKYVIEIDNYQLRPKDTFTIKTNGMGEKDITHVMYIVPWELSGLVIFDGLKCSKMYRGDNGEGIMNLRSYEHKKIENRYYQFTYTFTEKDYLKATPCKTPKVK